MRKIYVWNTSRKWSDACFLSISANKPNFHPPTYTVWLTHIYWLTDFQYYTDKKNKKANNIFDHFKSCSQTKSLIVAEHFYRDGLIFLCCIPVIKITQRKENYSFSNIFITSVFRFQFSLNLLSCFHQKKKIHTNKKHTHRQTQNKQINKKNSDAFCLLYFQFVSPSSLELSPNIQLITEMKLLNLHDLKLKGFFFF